MADEKLDTQVRREQIAAAALSLVANSGVRRLSVAAVARRVGLVPSGIYRHFKSKDEILEAVLELIETRVMDIIAAAEQVSSDPLERLHGVLQRHVRFIREGRAIPQIIFSEEVHVGHADRKERVRQILMKYLGHVKRFVQQGQLEGLIRKELDPHTVAMMFFGMIVPAGIVWHLTDGGIDVTQHAERAWLLFQRAITTDAT